MPNEFNKRSCLAAALGVTHFITIIATNLVKLLRSDLSVSKSDSDDWETTEIWGIEKVNNGKWSRKICYYYSCRDKMGRTCFKNISSMKVNKLGCLLKTNTIVLFNETSTLGVHSKPRQTMKRYHHNLWCHRCQFTTKIVFTV